MIQHRFRSSFWVLCAVLALTLCWVPGGVAYASSASGSVKKLALISSVPAHQGQPVLAGIDMQLASGWKTYWKNPGDSGIAPSFDWSRSENVASVEIRWPVPRRYDDPGDTTFGYEPELLLPLQIIPEDPSRPMLVHVVMYYGVCAKRICVPREDEVSLFLQPEIVAGDGVVEDIASGENAARLRGALARVPLPANDPKMLDIAWLENEAPTLDVRLKGCGTGCRAPVLIVDGPENIWFSPPEIMRHKNDVLYRMKVQVLSPAMLEGEKARFILDGQDGPVFVEKTF